jgi:hypothetical protein
MTLDDRAKRSYAIGVGLPVPTVYASPDGTISAPDRGNIAWSYHQIYRASVLANVTGNPTPLTNVTGNPTPLTNVTGNPTPTVNVEGI